MRKFLPLLIAVLLMPGFHASTTAQTEPSLRTIELRIAASSRGYCRPLEDTARRIATLEGIEDAKMLGFEGDNMLFEVTTALEDAALVRALGARKLGSGEDFLTVGPGLSERARRAEARLALVRIARKLIEQANPRPTNSIESSSSERPLEVREFVKDLGLEPSFLDGQFYKLSDYHVVATGDEDSPSYRLWAGSDKWEGIYVPEEYYFFYDDNEGRQEAPRVLNPRFVGLRVDRSYWRNSYRWADAEGILIAGTDGRRSDTDSEGVLYIQHGAEWLVDILKAAVAHHVRNPTKKPNELPGGRGGWDLFRRIDENNNDLNRWYIDKYYGECFRLAWEKRDGSIFVTVTAHHERSPYHLAAEVNSSAVVKRYEERAENEEIDFSSLTEADLGDELNWIVAAEEGPEIFERRREQAFSVFTQIRNGLSTAMDEHGPEIVAGTLGDPGKLELLGVEMPDSAEFRPKEYEITPQVLGDVELRVGSVRSGGVMWMLVNAETGDVIRSSQ